MGHLIGVLFLSPSESGLVQGTVYESVFGIHDGGFRVFVGLLLDAFRLVVADALDGVAVGQHGHHLFRLLVVLQQFDGEVSGGVFVADLLVVLQLLFDGLDTAFDGGSVVEVDMPAYAVVGPVAVGEVLAVVAAVFALIVLVPVLDFGRHFGVDVSLFVDEVHALIEVDDDMEEQVDPHARLERGGNHGHAEELCQFVVVELVAPGLHLVIHVECAHHAQVHVHELGGEIEVAFQVAGIDDIDDHVGCLVDELSSHIEFFGAVGRERVGAGQVDQVEVVALVVGIAVLGVDGHSRVVAHMLVGA